MRKFAKFFFHFLLNMRKLKNCKSVFFCKISQKSVSQKNAKFSRNQRCTFFSRTRLMLIFAKKSENFPNFTEKFRPLVNKTSVQKKYTLFSINFYFSETGACLGGRRTYLTRLSSDQLGTVYLTNI